MRLAIIVLAIVGLLAAGFGVLHHMRGPRLQLTVSPRPPLTISYCSIELVHFGSNAAPDGGCIRSQGHPWYHAVVRNTGHRGAWVSTCTATGWDGSGRTVRGLVGFEVPMWITSPGVGARPHLDPGQSVSLDWFVPVHGTADRYTATCSYIVYSKPPV